MLGFLWVRIIVVCPPFSRFHRKMIRQAPRTWLIEMVMPTRNVVLMDSQAEFVEQMVASGHYQIASEVLREGLRLVQA